MPAQVSDWLQRFSEPTRSRPRHQALDHHNRNANWFGTGTSPFLRDWFRPFSEPVRSRPRAPFFPFLAQQIIQRGFRLSVTERPDTGAWRFYNLQPIGMGAQVTITEIAGQRANVSIVEIKKNRGYR